MSFWLERLSILLQIYTFACNFCSRKGGRASPGFNISHKKSFCHAYVCVQNSLYWRNEYCASTYVPLCRSFCCSTYLCDKGCLKICFHNEKITQIKSFLTLKSLRITYLFKVNPQFCVVYI